MAGRAEIVLLNRIEELPRLQQALYAFAEKHGLARKVLLKLNLILEELVTNVIRHGYEDDAEHQITIGLALDAGRLRIEVEDDGRHFDPRDVPPPDIEASLQERSDLACTWCEAWWTSSSTTAATAATSSYSSRAARERRKWAESASRP